MVLVVTMYIWFKHSTSVLLFALLAIHSYAGNQIGTPFIESFPSETYNAGTQNWDIAQDPRSVLYFGNNDGLLTFDGSSWVITPLPDKTIVRSVEVDEAGHIYVGGQNEFGRYLPDAIGNWNYESLKAGIPEMHRDFEDVWNLHSESGSLSFRSSGKLYQYDGAIWTVNDELPIQFLNRDKNRLLAQSEDGRIYWYRGGKWDFVDGSELLENTTITGLIDLETDTFLLTTYQDGIFICESGRVSRWVTKHDPFLKENFINCAARLYDGSIALGTYLEGLVVLDRNGRIVHHIARTDGLLNNNISSLFIDASHNLWVGSGNGINYVQVNSAFLRVFPDGHLKGTGYAIQSHEDNIYFGTSNGLYRIPWPGAHRDIETLKQFIPVQGTLGQTWGLDIIGDDLILSHHQGAFRIRNEQAIKIMNGMGVWLIEQYEGDRNLVGTYEGLQVCDYSDGIMTPIALQSDFGESSRFVEVDHNGHIWISHPYRGVFRLEINDDVLEVSSYDEKKGLPDVLHNHLYKINDEILVCGETGVLIYDEATDRFTPYKALNRVFGTDVKIRRLFEAPNGNIWFVTENNVGYLEVTERLLDKDIEQVEFPELRPLLNDGFESIYPFDEEHIFLTAKQGFIHYLPKKPLAADSAFQVLLNSVKIYGDPDSTVFAGVFTQDSSMTLRQPESMIHAFERGIIGLQFSYTATDYTDNSALQFRHYLEGYEADWSAWSTTRINEYTNLPAGSYTFKVQARRLNGEVTPVLTYTFEIEDPWYNTPMAKLLALFIFVTILFFILRTYRRKFEAIRAEADQTVKNSKIEIDRLERQSIQRELEHKNRELVSSALHISRKNEILNQITERLSTIAKACSDDQTVAELKKLKHLLRNEEVVEDGWENFMLHFNELNKGYIDGLKDEFSALSPKDIKLCTYLKMNLSSKEIASIMNVSIRAVEASRYRLRKKLNLDGEDNLTEFLMAYKGPVEPE